MGFLISTVVGSRGNSWSTLELGDLIEFKSEVIHCGDDGLPEKSPRCREILDIDYPKCGSSLDHRVYRRGKCLEAALEYVMMTRSPNNNAYEMGTASRPDDFLNDRVPFCRGEPRCLPLRVPRPT